MLVVVIGVGALAIWLTSCAAPGIATLLDGRPLPAWLVL